jgi:hypothetical protein
LKITRSILPESRRSKSALCRHKRRRGPCIARAVTHRVSSLELFPAPIAQGAA